MRRSARWGALALLLAAPVHASAQAHVAQSASLAGARTALATYDLGGTRTLTAIRDLGSVAAGGSSDAPEAQYLRAMAATDVHLAALGLADTALDARLAEALGVPPDHLGDELRTELGRARVGLYRAPIAAELALLSHAEAFADGGPLDLGNAREAGLFSLGAGRAAGARDFHGMPAGATTAPAWLVGPESGGLAQLRAGLTAYERATRGIRDGDPLLAAWSSALDAARGALLAFEMRASPSAVGDPAIALAAADAAADPGTVPDVVIVIEATRIAIACGARVRVTSASDIATTPPSAACPAPGTVSVTALPATLPAVPGPIDAIVAALTALALPSTAIVAIAPTETTPMHVVARVVRSAARASVTPTLVAFASGPELRTVPLALSFPAPRAAATAAAAPADAPSITIHVRLGGYAVERVHGHDTQVPRIHGPTGLVYDHAGLTAALAADAVTHAAVDGMGPVPAVEVLRAMRTLASSGARVTLALP